MNTKLTEARHTMEDETLLKYVDDCVTVLRNAGYEATMSDIDCVVSDATTTFGSMRCKTAPYSNYTLTLSSHLAGEPEDAIKNTIYHELCHYLQYKENFASGVWMFVGSRLRFGYDATRQQKLDSKGHGRVWKKLANEVGRLTNQKITRTNTFDTHKNVGQAYDDKIKYIVRCTECGSELKYTRITEFVKDPNVMGEYFSHDKGYYTAYKWRCGHCKAAGKWEVIKRK